MQKQQALPPGHELPQLSLPQDYVRFYDSFKPPLESGSYLITVSQKVVDETGRHKLAEEPFTQYQSFDVLGPRFRLEPSDVFSVSPPGAAEGEFADLLPHIVLTRRSLPWERQFGPASSNTPWLALLLLDEGEIMDGGDPEANPTLGQTLEVRQAVNLPLSGNVLTAQLVFSQYDDPATKCRVIDLPPGVFADIAPKVAELPFLAHCRQVDINKKEVLDSEDRGWFSIVVSNRFPNPNARSIVHLVSLESFENYLPDGTLPDGARPLKDYSKVRLISLASWYFTSRKTRGNFASLSQNLDVGLLRMPVSDEARQRAQTPAQKLVLNAFDIGYSLIKYAMRQGEKSMAWYRGPLLPVATDHVKRAKPFATSDSALIYDQKTGMFDLSYATAWQVGRLVALADKSFARHVLELRREGHALRDMIIERRYLMKAYGDALNFPATIDEILEPHLMLDLVLDFLANRLSVGAERDPTGLLDRLDELPGVLSKKELDELLVDGGDPIAALRRRVFGQ